MPNIVIATTTMYESTEDTRFKLALKTVEAANKNGYIIIIADQSTNSEIPLTFMEKLESGKVLQPNKERTMGESIRAAISEADEWAGSDGFIVRMELEKHTFVRFIQKIVSFMVTESVDLVIPRRKSMESYPYLQQLNEPLGNEIFRIATGVSLDIYFGPQIFCSHLATYYLQHKGERWDAIHCPAIGIIADGHRVAEYPVNYKHPPEQKEEDTWEMVERRLEQLIVLAEAVRKDALRYGLPKN